MITMTMTTSMNIAVFLVFGVFANEFFQCSAVKNDRKYDRLSSVVNTNKSSRTDGTTGAYHCTITWPEHRDDVDTNSSCSSACIREGGAGYGCTGYEFAFETNSCILFFGSLGDESYNRLLHNESRKLMPPLGNRLCYRRSYDKSTEDFNCFQGDSFVRSRPTRKRCRQLSLRRNANGFLYDEEEQKCTIYDTRGPRSSQMTERCELNFEQSTEVPEIQAAPAIQAAPDIYSCPCFNNDSIEHGLHLYDVDDNSSCFENRGAIGMYFIDHNSGYNPYFEVRSDQDVCVINGITQMISPAEKESCREILNNFC